MLAYYANLRIDKFKYFTRHAHWLDPLFQWDGPWYWSIVKDGYSYDPDTASNVAFFPLYPLLVKLASFVIGDTILSGFIVSNLCLLFAGVMLYKLCEGEGWGRDIARKSVLYMFIFPTGFFASAYYTEGLFLLLTVSTFYFARRRAWFPACLLAALAGATKIYGVLLAIPLGIEYFGIQSKRPFVTRRKPGRDIFWFALIPMGVTAFMGFMYLRFGNAMAFVQTQVHWNRVSLTLGATYESLLRVNRFDQLLILGSLVILAVCMGELLMRRIPLSYVSFIVAVILLVMVSGTLVSVQRYVSGLFPVFVGVAFVAQRNQIIELFITVLFSMFMALFVILFSSGYNMY